MQLILSLFPGADLFGRAFESAGFCVVRGPDKLWGGDVAGFHVPPGRFDGIIGGPPCQVFSSLTAMSGTNAVNLIPEFARLVDEAAPAWAIMENVIGAAPYAPPWPSVVLNDWDCGGLTKRKRQFWFYGIPAPLPPPARDGEGDYSVLASQWKIRTGKQGGTPNMHQVLTVDEAARLQGFPALGQQLVDSQPDGLSSAARRVLAIHLLGNGVPYAMGMYLARHVVDYQAGRASYQQALFSGV